jgi:hypothetical protein
MRLATPIRLDPQIAAPDPIARDRAWRTMLQPSPGFVDRILISLNRLCDISLIEKEEAAGAGVRSYWEKSVERVPPTVLLSIWLVWQLNIKQARPEWAAF